MEKQSINVEFLGMKFATGEKAKCKKAHPKGYLKVDKEYLIEGNAGVDSENPGITEYIVISANELEHQNGLEPYLQDGTVAFSTEYFEAEEGPSFISII
jgi:hypothetical protein